MEYDGIVLLCTRVLIYRYLLQMKYAVDTLNVKKFQAKIKHYNTPRYHTELTEIEVIRMSRENTFFLFILRPLAGFWTLEHVDTQRKSERRNVWIYYHFQPQAKVYCSRLSEQPPQFPSCANQYREIVAKLSINASRKLKLSYQSSYCLSRQCALTLTW